MVQEKKIAYSFLGLPASGKGTQAEIFAKKKKYDLISIGDLIRKEIEENPDDPETLKIQKDYNDGIPQADEIIFNLIKKRLETLKEGVVFDNFPFSEKQAKLLLEYTEKHSWEKPVIIFIHLKPETLSERILNRMVCPDCNTIYKSNIKNCPKCGSSLIKRSDDTKEVLETRIKYYEPRLEAMLEFFSKNGKVIKIDGEPPIEEVAKSINKI